MSTLDMEINGHVALNEFRFCTSFHLVVLLCCRSGHCKSSVCPLHVTRLATSATMSPVVTPRNVQSSSLVSITDIFGSLLKGGHCIAVFWQIDLDSILIIIIHFIYTLKIQSTNSVQ